MLNDYVHHHSTLTASEALSLIMIDKMIDQEAPSLDGAARIASSVYEKYGKRVNVSNLFSYWQESLDSHGKLK